MSKLGKPPQPEQLINTLREIDVMTANGRTILEACKRAGTPTHELQRLGGWRTGVMVERYAHLAPDHLAEAASRLDL